MITSQKVHHFSEKFSTFFQRRGSQTLPQFGRGHTPAMLDLFPAVELSLVVRGVECMQRCVSRSK